MQKIVYFPAGSYNPNPIAINQSAVPKVDEKRLPVASGGTQYTARLSIDPWDLWRIIQEANRVGLEGQKVEGFGYMVPEESITLSFAPRARSLD